MITIKSDELFVNKKYYLEVFFVIVPYIIIVRFLLINLFSAIVYRGYELSRK